MRESFLSLHDAHTPPRLTFCRKPRTSLSSTCLQTSPASPQSHVSSFDQHRQFCDLSGVLYAWTSSAKEDHEFERIEVFIPHIGFRLQMELVQQCGMPCVELDWCSACDLLWCHLRFCGRPWPSCISSLARMRMYHREC